jgi:hypothetical protein
VQIPKQVVELAYPAQRYARRRRQAFIRERRLLHRLAEPGQVAEDDTEQAGPDEESVHARAQTLRDHRLARIGSIAADQDELLSAKAEELVRMGATQIRTPTGAIAARLVRFRWGKDVIDISRSKEGGRSAGWSLGTVPRLPTAARTAAITFELTKALAALERFPPFPPSSANRA